MKNSLEARLERSGRTLDEASADYMAGTDITADSSAVPAGSSSRSGRRLAAVAAALAIVVVGVAVAATLDSNIGQDPATDTSDPRTALATAVEVTRSVSAMAIDIHGSWPGAPAGAEAIWNYGAPDRWEQLEQSNMPRINANPPGGATMRLYVGTETWAAGADGRWTQEQQAHPDEPAPVAMLDRIAALECAAIEDDYIIGWAAPSSGCTTTDGKPPAELPVGTEVWVLDLDNTGRIAEARSGEVLDIGAQRRAVNASPEPLGRLGAAGGVTTRFWYENIPEVSGQPAE